jgi:hypothetical protein
LELDVSLVLGRLELGAFHLETPCVVSDKFKKPWFRFAGKFPGLAAPGETQGTGMEGVVLKNEPGALFVSETLLDEGEIEILVAAIDFVADDGMAEVGKMDADLMLAAGAGLDAEQGEAELRVESCELRAARLTPALSPHRVDGEGERRFGRARHSVRAVMGNAPDAT